MLILFLAWLIPCIICILFAVWLKEDIDVMVTLSMISVVPVVNLMTSLALIVIFAGSIIAALILAARK